MKSRELALGIGPRLSELRCRLSLSKNAFANRLDTSSGFISDIESGRTILGAALLVKIAHEWPHVDLRWLLTGAGVCATDRASNAEAFDRGVRVGASTAWLMMASHAEAAAKHLRAIDDE